LVKRIITQSYEIAADVLQSAGITKPI